MRSNIHALYECHVAGHETRGNSLNCAFVENMFLVCFFTAPVLEDDGAEIPIHIFTMAVCPPQLKKKFILGDVTMTASVDKQAANKWYFVGSICHISL